MTDEQKEALQEAIVWANDEGLPGTADTLRSILQAARATPADQSNTAWKSKAKELYERCAVFPENSGDGFMALLELRNHVGALIKDTPADHSDEAFEIQMYCQGGRWKLMGEAPKGNSLSPGSNTLYLRSAPQNAADHSDDSLNVAIALERVRALEIVAAVRADGFAKSSTAIPTQSESIFDLACEEIDHRLRNEKWELNGVSAPVQNAADHIEAQSVPVDLSEPVLTDEECEQIANIINMNRKSLPPRKYDPATQWGSPEFDGAEAYQAHLEAMYPDEAATQAQQSEAQSVPEKGAGDA